MARVELSIRERLTRLERFVARWSREDAAPLSAAERAALAKARDESRHGRTRRLVE